MSHEMLESFGADGAGAVAVEHPEGHPDHIPIVHLTAVAVSHSNIFFGQKNCFVSMYLKRV